MGSIYQRTTRRKDGTVCELPTLWIKYRQHGRVMRETTGTRNRVVARRLLKTREGDVAHGKTVNPQMDRISFEDAAQDVLNDYRMNGKRTLADTQRRFDLHVGPAFKGRLLASVTPADLRAYAAARQAAGASNATVNRELAFIKRMFSLAVKDAKVTTRPYVPLLREDNVRRGFFEPEQFDAVRSALPDALKPVVTFAYLTGWRIASEVFPLEWRQVDWTGRVVRLDPGTTKNGEGRSFPFTAALEELLTAQLAEHNRLKAANRITPLVFHRQGRRIKHFRGSWATACKQAGCPGRIPHDFRRTAVRNLERAGVSRSAAMAMVGHKTEAIYRRYAIVDAGALRDAAAKIDRSLGTLLGTVTPSTPQPAETRSA